MNDTEWVACNRRPMGGNKSCSNMRSLIAKYAISKSFKLWPLGSVTSETWLDSGWKPPNLRDIGEEPFKELRWVVIAHDHISRQLRPLWRLRNPGRVEDDEVKGLLGKPIGWAKLGKWHLLKLGTYTTFVIFDVSFAISNVKMVWRRCRATKKWVDAGGNSTVPEVKDPLHQGYECSNQCNRFAMNTNNTGNSANPAIRSFTSNKQTKWNADKSANPSNCLMFIHFRPNIHPSPKFSNTRHLLQSIEQISTLHCDILRPAVPLQLRLDREHSVGATVRGHDAHRGIEVVPQQKADDLGICIQSLDEHSYSLLKSSSQLCPGFQKMSVVTAHLICNRTWYTGDHRSWRSAGIGSQNTSKDLHTLATCCW